MIALSGLALCAEEAKRLQKRNKRVMVGGSKPKILQMLARELLRRLSLLDLSEELANLSWRLHVIIGERHHFLWESARIGRRSVWLTARPRQFTATMLTETWLYAYRIGQIDGPSGPRPNTKNTAPIKRSEASRLKGFDRRLFFCRSERGDTDG